MLQLSGGGGGGRPVVAGEAGARRLGRLRRSNVAQGGTSSFWAGLLGEALHGTRPSLVLWECATYTT